MGLETRTEGTSANGVGQVCDMRDTPVGTALGNGKADRTTEAPDGQVEGKDGGHIVVVRWDVKRGKKEGMA